MSNQDRRLISGQVELCHTRSSLRTGVAGMLMFDVLMRRSATSARECKPASPLRGSTSTAGTSLVCCEHDRSEWLQCGNSPPTELVYLFGVDSQVTQAACKTMQHWGSFPVQSLDMARPLSRTIPVALAIMLAISSNAIDARELEVQHSSVKQKPSTSIPWPRSRPKEAPA
jgi:hypothetical protein